jgi:death on curing protein
MIYLTVDRLLELHQMLLEQTGGAVGLRDRGALESAVAQPQMTFGGQELYPTLVEKASALAFSLIQNHPFVDGNKRAGHAAMETFLVLNGCELACPVDEQEQTILQVASSILGRDGLTAWVRTNLVPRKET